MAKQQSDKWVDSSGDTWKDYMGALESNDHGEFRSVYFDGGHVDFVAKAGNHREAVAMPVDVVCEVLRRAGYTVVEPGQTRTIPLPDGWTIKFSDTLNSWVAHNGHLVAYGHDEESCRNNAQAVRRMHAVASPNYRSTCTRCDDTGLIGSGVFLPQESCPDCGGTNA